MRSKNISTAKAKKITRQKILTALPDFPVVKNLKESFYVLDHEMNFIFANTKALKMWSKKPEDVLGKNIWKIFPGAVDSESYRRHLDAWKKNKPQRFEAISPVLKKWLEVNVVPVNKSYLVVYFHDISRRKELEHKLLEQAELLQLSQDAFIVQSQDNIITFWSLGAQKMYGFSEKEALGKVGYKLLKTRFPLPLASLHELIKNNKVWKGELVHMTAKGKEITVESRWSLIESPESGGRFSVLEVNTDISRRKELENQRENFISFATHELNAPLAALKVFNHLLKREIEKSGDEKGLKLLHKASAQVFRMTDLVSYFLDDARVQTGKLSLNKDKFLLDELMKEAVDTIRRTAGGMHKITLVTSKSIYVNADRQRIQQVVVNILSNAIKYSSDVIKIHVAVKKRSKDYLITIRDNGIGIAKKDLPNAFDRFYQSEDMNERKTQGLGLGLYISKEIIKKHNGEIWVESEKGHGSIFYFTLPRE